MRTYISGGLPSIHPIGHRMRAGGHRDDVDWMDGLGGRLVSSRPTLDCHQHRPGGSDVGNTCYIHSLPAKSAIPQPRIRSAQH